MLPSEALFKYAPLGQVAAEDGEHVVTRCSYESGQPVMSTTRVKRGPQVLGAPNTAAMGADQLCYTTGRIPGGKNPVTGAKYNPVNTGFCCGQGSCFSWRHEDVS